MTSTTANGSIRELHRDENDAGAGVSPRQSGIGGCGFTQQRAKMGRIFQLARLVLALSVLDGFAGLAHAAPPLPFTLPFPMMGIGFNQTLQLNVVAWPGASCDITFAIFDRNGTTVTSGKLAPPATGVAYANLQVAYKNYVSGFPNRAEFYANVTLTPTGTYPCGLAQASAEVFDDLTNTDWALWPPSPVIPNPYFLGPVGLIAEQSARPNIVAYPPNPCAGTISFIDSSGNPVGAVGQVNLSAGQTTYIDLAGQQLALGMGQRREVIGVSSTQGACLASVEVFDQISGYTRVLWPPGPVIPSN
jgi:hypothetical protein